MNVPALADIKAANAAVDDRGYALVSFSRRFGPYLAWLALRLGRTPRQVNYFSLVLAFAILGLVAFAGTPGRLAGTLLVFAWQIVDVTDGTMARALRIRDNFGGFVDYATGIVLASFLPLALGAGLWASPDGSLSRVLSRPDLSPSSSGAIAFAAGAAVSALSLYMRLLNRVLVIRFGEALQGSRAGLPQAEGPGRLALKNLETIGGLQAVVWCAGAFGGVLEVVLAGYAAFYVLLLGAFAASTYRGYSRRTRYAGE